MTTIRRIYTYLMAFAGLAMLAVGVANLGQLVVDVVALAAPATNAQYVRDTVALNAAAALIGLPVWLLHWLWTERLVRADAGERASGLRRLYLYAVLAAAMAQIAYAAHESLFSVVVWLDGAHAAGSASALEVTARQQPLGVVAVLVWLAHWRVASRDRDLIGERGGSATLRRWYIYGAAFVGLLTLLNGASGLLQVLWQFALEPTAQAAAGGLATPIANVLVGL